MFRFSPPVEYNRCVAPICLPKQGYVFEPMTDTYAIGWGNLHCKDQLTVNENEDESEKIKE